MRSTILVVVLLFTVVVALSQASRSSVKSNMATRARPKAPVLTLNKILKSKSAGAVQGDVKYKDLEKKNAEQDKVMGKLQEDFNEKRRKIAI